MTKELDEALHGQGGNLMQGNYYIKRPVWAVGRRISSKNCMFDTVELVFETIG